MRAFKMAVKIIKCPTCTFTSRDNWVIKRHMKIVHDKIKDLTCELCDYKTGRFDRLRHHVKEVHEKAKHLMCER